MTVYVDKLKAYTVRNGQARKHGSLWCHLWADDPTTELHSFAGKLGLARFWFQISPVLDHYDLTPNKRRQAIKAGAIEFSLKDWLKRRRYQPHA